MPTNISKFSTAQGKSSQVELLLGPIGEEQTSLIFEKISESFEKNRNFLVLVPTSQVKRGVSEKLLRLYPGWLGNRVQTLHEFAYGISNTRFGSQVRELLWWMLDLKNIPNDSSLGKLKKFPNTISALSIAVRELAEGDVSSDAFERFSHNSSLLRQLSSLYKEALEVDIVPLQGAIRKAIDVLNSGKRFDDIFVTGFLYFHPTQLNLINALANSCESLTVTLPYEDVRPNIYGLTEDNVLLLPTHRKVLISRSKFVEDIPLNIIEGRTISEEVSSLLYEIKKRLIDGVDANKIVILLREPFRYRSSILRGAEEFDVPISSAGAKEYMASIWLRRIKSELPTVGTIDEYISISEKKIDDLKGIESSLWRELKSTLEELIVHLNEVRDEKIELREWESLWGAQREEREKFQSKREGSGVSLLEIEQPHWGGYEVVSIPGMVEHWFPKPPPNPPILNYSIREDLNNFLGRKALWLSSQYRVREELLFTIAIDRSSSELLLTNPARSNDNKKIRRSHLFEEILHLHPSPIRLEPKLKEATPRRIIETILRNESEVLHDESVNYIRKRHKASLHDLRRKISIERIRVDGIGEFNGEIVDDYIVEAFVRRPIKEGRGFSTTSIERYGQCPFRYLSRDVLKLPEPEEPSDGISSLDAGSILHEILHRFYEGRIRRGEGGIDLENLSGAVYELDSVATEVLNEKGDIAKDIHPIIWEEECLTVKRMLRDVIKRDAEIFNEKRSKPSQLEYSFSIPIEIDNIQNINITGQIDRIDELDDKNLFVIDYKRGKYVPTVSGIEDGISLQLPLYLMAVKKLFNKNLSGGAYFAISDKDLKGGLPSRSMNLERGIERSVSWAKEYIGAIHRGSFHVKPKECRGEDCAFNRICRVNRLVRS